MNQNSFTCPIIYVFPELQLYCVFVFFARVDLDYFDDVALLQLFSAMF